MKRTSVRTTKQMISPFCSATTHKFNVDSYGLTRCQLPGSCVCASCVLSVDGFTPACDSHEQRNWLPFFFHGKSFLRDIFNPFRRCDICAFRLRLRFTACQTNRHRWHWLNAPHLASIIWIFAADNQRRWHDCVSILFEWVFFKYAWFSFEFYWSHRMLFATHPLLSHGSKRFEKFPDSLFSSLCAVHMENIEIEKSCNDNEMSYSVAAHGIRVAIRNSPKISDMRHRQNEPSLVTQSDWKRRWTEAFCTPTHTHTARTHN